MSVELLNWDCMEYMRTLPDKAFDLAVCDPPYFKEKNYLSAGSATSTTGVARKRHKFNHWEIPGEEWLAELKRVSNHQIIWGCNYFEFIHARGRIIWDKQNDSSSFSHAEIASTDMMLGVRIIRYLWNGMLQADMKNKETRIHPCQKPVGLYQRVLKDYAKPGWKILDTHLGSGSSAIAAHYAGYDFVGCELDEDYYKAACKRFDAETRQQAMAI